MGSKLRFRAPRAQKGKKMFPTSKAVMQRKRAEAEQKAADTLKRAQEAEGERNMFQTRLTAAEGMIEEQRKQIEALKAERDALMTNSRELLRKIEVIAHGGWKAAWAVIKGKAMAWAEAQLKLLAARPEGHA